MSDREQNYELDDERLSAYLDDELSAEERAAIEARLAADPAAKRLLHELQSVSQAVQALPQEAVGRDLSGSVVRRAIEAKQSMGIAGSAKADAPDDRPSPLGNAMPKITIFGSPRAWFWASLAVAAGLMIMIFQSGNERAKKLPQLAQHDRRIAASGQSGKPARRALSEPARPAAPEAAPPDSVVADDLVVEELRSAQTAPGASQPMGQLRDLAKHDAAANSPLAAPSPAAQDSPVEPHEKRPPSVAGSAVGKAQIDGLAEQRTMDRASGDRQTPSISGGGQKSPPAGQRNPLVVVHVLAKREALQHNTFDRLLASHGIAIESQPPQGQTLAFGLGRFNTSGPKEPAVGRDSTALAWEQSADMILVDAPAQTIESCLAGLNQNSNDYLGIEVDEGPAPRDGANENAATAKKLANDLTRYDRGVIPQRQKDSVNRNEYYYHLDLPIERPSAGSSRNRPAGDMSSVRQETKGAKAAASADHKMQQVENGGRALRLQSSNADKFQAGEQAVRSGGFGFGGQAADESLKKATSEQKLRVATKSETDYLRVLFVLTPEDTPPSGAPPENRAK